MNMLTLQFFHAGNFDFSHEQIKAIMGFCREMITSSHEIRDRELEKQHKEGYPFKSDQGIPANDRILNYDKRASNKFPKLMTTEHVIEKGFQRHKVYFNLPEKHIAQALSNPQMTRKITKLADHTPDMMYDLNGGRKWQENQNLL